VAAQYLFQRDVEHLFADPAIAAVIPDLDGRGRTEASRADLADLATPVPQGDVVTAGLAMPEAIGWLYVYQPLAANDGDWAIRSFWDRRMPEQTYNFQFSGPNKTTMLPADLGNSCTVHAMQRSRSKCGPGSDPYCPGSDLE